MEFIQECAHAFGVGDLSTCKPLGLDLGTWGGLFGVSIVAALALFWKTILTAVKVILRRIRQRWQPIPPRQRSKLFGRDRDIARIDAAFKANPTTIAVTGQGGIGKTALAEEYGYLRTRSGRYRDWVLVSTASETEMANGLCTIAKLLGVPDDVNPKTVIDLTYKKMAESGSRWLVILDNVDDKDGQRRVLKNLRSAAGVDHVITSRISDWHGRAVVVDLDLLTPSDAVELLTSASGRESSDALRSLAIETLERLPLALVVAGADLRLMNIDAELYASEFNR